MISRDSLMDTTHFERVLSELQGALQEDDSLWNQTIVLPQIVPAMYSAGCAIEELRPVVRQWIMAATQKRYPNQADIVFPLCFSVLLGADEEDRQNLESVLAKDDDCGIFAGFLAEAMGLLHPPVVVSEPLWRFFPQVRDIEDAGGKADVLATYLKEDWYDDNSEEVWWNSHEEYGGRFYCGYWAWEIAATARVYGLDDTALCSCRYYPVDLAHYLDATNGMSEGAI